jgi:hypothetical protein
VGGPYPRGVSALSQFGEFERSYLALGDAFGALVVARHRGDDVTTMERAYGEQRRAIAAALVERDGTWAPDEQPMVASIESALGWMDEWEAVEGLAEVGGPEVEPAEVVELRRRTFRAFGEAAAVVRVGSEVIDRVTAFARLSTEPDPARRRAVFDALEPVWRAVHGDGGPSSPYRTLVRSSAARWAREGSLVEGAASALGMAAGSLEPTLREVLAVWREVRGPQPVEPWDYRYLVGSMERRVGALIPRERLQPINDAHLRSLGADPEGLLITYDVHPRPGRPPIATAFTIGSKMGRLGGDGVWQPATPWIFATYASGGLGNLEELLHESGHALHEAAIRARPALYSPLAEDGGLAEGLGDLVGWDAHEPALQRRHLGAAADLRESRLGRYGGVMLDICWALFEIVLHRDPDLDPNLVWAELTETGLGIVPHPEQASWAVRGQLIDGPGYMANYALSAMVAAAVRARIREVRGDWLAEGGDPGWYSFVSDGLLRFGATRPAAAVLTDFLGGPLTAAPLLDDLAVAAG